MLERYHYHFLEAAYNVRLNDEYVRQAHADAEKRMAHNHKQASYVVEKEGFRPQPVAELGGGLAEQAVRQFLDELGHQYGYCGFSPNREDWNKPDFNVNGFQLEVKHTTKEDNRTLWLTDKAREANAVVLVYVPFDGNQFDTKHIELLGWARMTEWLKTCISGRGYGNAYTRTVDMYMYELAERLEQRRG